MFLHNKKIAEYGSLSSVRKNPDFKNFTISNQKQEDEDCDLEAEEKILNSSFQEKSSLENIDSSPLTNPKFKV